MAEKISSDPVEQARYEVYCAGWDAGVENEQERIIDLLMELKAIRRCAATNKLVAFNTDGDKVIYLTGLETLNA